MLWVERGGELWKEPAGPEAKSCASCHGPPEAMKGVGRALSLVDEKLGQLVNIETRIQACVAQHQRALVPPYESQGAAGLDGACRASVARTADVGEDRRARCAVFRARRQLFHEKQGHLDLSCAQCHVENWGKRLRTETVSQGYAMASRPTAWNGRRWAPLTVGCAPASRASERAFLPG